MLAEDVGHISDQDIPQNAAAYAGDSSQKCHSEPLSLRQVLKGQLGAHHHKQAQAHGVRRQEELFKQDGAAHEPAADRGQIGRHGHRHRNAHGQRIIEYLRRGDPQQQIPQNAAAHSGNQAQNHHAQGIQGLAQGRHSAGHGKGRRAQQFQKNKKLFYSAP